MAEQLLDFTGKVVVATGAATGIGRATALAFARQSATVVIGDVDERAAGGGAIAVRNAATTMLNGSVVFSLAERQ
jgi:NAD(P)-dependent dehydrogenase (short-subunit alcohol dehydrogenase family)